MDVWHALLLILAGLVAGTINAVAGSGTLITFPALLAAGLPPVAANIANSVGLVPGSFSAAWGYRGELAGQRVRIARLSVASVLGGITGALLLLRLPASAFRAIVPALVAVAIVLVIVQPRIARAVARRRDAPLHGGKLVLALVFTTGVYGGYFGAAQGVLLIGILGIALDETLQRVNATKNVLAGLVNGVAATLFIVLGGVSWRYALLVAAGSIAGGRLGARVGRRLPVWFLRSLIVAAGVAALVKLLL